MSLNTLKRGIRYTNKSYTELYNLAEKRGLSVIHIKKDDIARGLIYSKATTEKGNYIMSAHYGGNVAEWTEYNI